MDAAVERARAHALKLLKAHARSRADVENRLIGAGHEPSAVSEVLDALERVGLINDRQLARDHVDRVMAKAAKSAEALEHELRAKGVPDALARDIAAEAWTERDALTEATALARARLRRSARGDAMAAARRVVAYLVRRGFDHDVASRAVSSIVGRAEETDQ